MASGPLRVLLVEDSEDDALLLIHQLERQDTALEFRRVDTAADLQAALAKPGWDCVISDYQMPGFSGLAALEIVRRHSAELSFILVSATIGEEAAVAAMKAGASDYVMKNNLARLLPAFQRELREAQARRENQEKFHYLAYYDSVTGLANRTLFGERLAQFIGSAKDERGTLAVVVVELEKIAVVNDSLGRQAGDALLGQIGERLKRWMSDPSRLARVSADRFAIVLAGPRQASDVAHRVEQLFRECFAEPFSLDGSDFQMKTKAGIALYPGDGASAALLLRNAEAATARARAGGEPYLFYAEQMTTRITEQLAMEGRLRGALANGEFRLHYQPKVDLEYRRIGAVEALIRCQNPELGLVFPAQFIALLEETGMIRDVGAWVLTQAVRDHRHWAEQGIDAPRIAVNVSVAQLHRHDFVAVVKDAICTGYSSLACLAKLPIQALKIDCSFTAAMLDHPDTMTLVRAIVTLAHSLGLAVIAEGVETEEQARALRSLGCDQMQGYLIGRPVPRDEMTAILRRQGNATPATA